MKRTPEKLLSSGVSVEWLFRARLLVFSATLLLGGGSGIDSANEVSTWEQQVIHEPASLAAPWGSTM